MSTEQPRKNNGSKRRSKPKKPELKNKPMLDKRDLDVSGDGGAAAKGQNSKKKKRKEEDSTGKGSLSKMKLDETASPENSDQPMIDVQTEKEDPAKVSMLTDSYFADRSDIHELSKKAIANVLKLERMTEIQKGTYEAASKGKDVLGRARTGTGKTMAFLLPALERILDPASGYVPGEKIGVLVLSPTRELAIQIADQAQKLLTYHKKMSVQTIYGGSSITKDVSRFNKNLPSILVATPGRLLDHTENTKLSNGKSFKDVLNSTSLLVLDETDRLLDMGFRREIAKITACLPPKDERQTLLFSATIPDTIRQVLKENMRPNYVDVDCIGIGGGDGGAVASAHTNARVNQSHVVLPNMDRFVSSVIEIVTSAMQEKEDDNVKIVAFFPTARMVGFFAQLFNDALGIEVVELHSRKSQPYRNKASEKFRVAKQGILFTSDVSARGVDYPDVTKVIQFGLPESREQYIHRLGRTGRAGKTGRGLLVLAPYESKFLNQLKGLDIPVDDKTTNLLSCPPTAKNAKLLKDAMLKIGDGRECDKELTKSAKMAYSAFLGYYCGQIKRTHIQNKAEVVSIANNLSKLMGLDQPPSIMKRTIGKMGLKGVPGITIDNSEMQNSRQGRR